jgi:succinate dehydrogenase hydrophobic anchor subunit
VANQAPAQIAAVLHAQGKTYEDLVHMYADMVSAVFNLLLLFLVFFCVS